MNLEDLQWGLMMMVVGMGTVFALLALLMAVLMGIGRLDRKRPHLPPPPAHEAAPAEATPTVHIVADGLDEDQVAAITVAVMTHAEHRRRLAAPETRAHAPGSQLFASRWLAVGRGRESSPFPRERR